MPAADPRNSHRPLGLVVPLTLVTVGLSVAAVAQADGDCDGDAICFNEETTDDGYRLRAQNLTDFPVTYTVRVRTRNLTPDGARKVTKTLAPRESDVAISLRRTISDQPSRYRYSYDWTIGDREAVHDDDHVYRLPYASGKSYRVIQGFGSRFSHTGTEQYAVDFRMEEGTPVHAARSGVVARLEESNSIGCWEDGCGRHANYVVVLHDDGTTGEYYHLLKEGALVEVGERVVAGQKIALSGNTGHTTIPHLHFAVYRAVEWGNTQSVPIRFVSADGIIEQPRRGGRYQATPIRRASNDRAPDLKLTITE